MAAYHSGQTIQICVVSNPTIVPSIIGVNEVCTVSVSVSETTVRITGSEAAFEFPFENRYLDLLDLTVEEVTYESLL